MITMNVALASFLLLQKYLDEPSIAFLTLDDVKNVFNQNIPIDSNKFICSKVSILLSKSTLGKALLLLGGCQTQKS